HFNANFNAHSTYRLAT
ncbi:hypothetical protein D037_4942B, partial [Vibrio parahaemolyticus IDH02640]